MPSWKLFAIVIPICIAIDLFWLGIVMKNFYSQEIGELARRDGASMAPRWGAAFFVYVLIPLGIIIFVRPLIGADGSTLHALGYGALFGLVLYGVYDFTNLAVLDKWTLRVTLVDLAWGCALCGMTSVVMRWADRWLATSST